MKKFIIFLFLFPIIVSAFSGTANTIGGSTYYYFSDGLSGRANNIGGITYYYFNDGTAGTAMDVGGIKYFNFGASKYGSQKIDSNITFDYTPFNLDNLNIQGNYNLNLSSNEKVTLFDDADKATDYKVYSLLTNAVNDQCKLHTARQYELYKKYAKELALKYIKEKIGTKSATEAIDDCNKSIGGGEGVASPLIAIQCLQLATNERNSYLKNANNTYNLVLTKFNTADTYNKCIKLPCGKGYEWNKEKTKCILANNNNSNSSIKTQDASTIDNPVVEEKLLTTKIDKILSKKMSGNILLQVEKNGEGWYVNPANNKKYYLGRPTDAFSIMKNLGLGIKHNELQNYLKLKFPSRLSGKIVLDVENNGEAYYINPNNLKGYFLNRPEDAFNVMRELGLGITNFDIRKIDVGEVN